MRPRTNVTVGQRGPDPPVAHQPSRRPGFPFSTSKDAVLPMYSTPASSNSGYTYAKDRDVKSTMLQFNIFVQAMIGICVLTLFISLFTLSGVGMFCVVLTLLICIGSFIYARFLVEWIMSKDAGTPEMRVISDAIREGAESFLYVQYSAIASVACVVAAVLFLIYMFRETAPSMDVSQFTLAVTTVFSFAVGSACSAMAGYLGVWVSVRVNIRAAAAAARYSYPDALQLSFRGGAVSSVLSAAMCITGLAFLYVFMDMLLVGPGGIRSDQVPILLSGYGFGASFVGLFMQLGGGIFTKAADVGADLVGKVEQDIPEDDPRNPAVIADLVGDNVGDCAGSMADVFESIAAEIIGTMILGGALARGSNLGSSTGFIFFPLMIHGLDLVVSGIGIYLVRATSDTQDPLASMKQSYAVSLGLAIVLFVTATRVMLYTEVAPNAWKWYSCCGVIGIVCSYLLVLITQYYTDYDCGPVRKIAKASETGHGTNIIAGISVGMESTALPTIVICSALLASYWCGKASGLAGENAGIFGTACATMGMLCTAVFILSMNNFGPIADNAGGIVEMSEQPEAVRKITDRLDAVGNVTKAATKGYAVGGSALACFVLFQAFLDEINEFSRIKMEVINLARVEIIVGGMLGISLVFLFTGWAIDAVGRTAQDVVWEVRRQFKELNIMDGSQKPDYGTCVTIVTRAALREMFRPAVLALATPVVTGILFKTIGSYTGDSMLGVEVLGSMLVFGTLTGLMMAIFLDNSGGAWDNAKKFVELHGGKGTETHHASVTGDTVGDPFKDTAGPSLHVVITTMSTTALVLGPMFIGSQTHL